MQSRWVGGMGSSPFSVCNGNTYLNGSVFHAIQDRTAPHSNHYPCWGPHTSRWLVSCVGAALRCSLECFCPFIPPFGWCTRAGTAHYRNHGVAFAFKKYFSVLLLHPVLKINVYSCVLEGLCCVFLCSHGWLPLMEAKEMYVMLLGCGIKVSFLPGRRRVQFRGAIFGQHPPCPPWSWAVQICPEDVGLSSGAIWLLPLWKTVSYAYNEHLQERFSPPSSAWLSSSLYSWSQHSDAARSRWLSCTASICLILFCPPVLF